MMYSVHSFLSWLVIWSIPASDAPFNPSIELGTWHLLYLRKDSIPARSLAVMLTGHRKYFDTRPISYTWINDMKHCYIYLCEALHLQQQKKLQKMTKLQPQHPGCHWHKIWEPPARDITSCGSLHTSLITQLYVTRKVRHTVYNWEHLIHSQIETTWTTFLNLHWLSLLGISQDQFASNLSFVVQALHSWDLCHLDSSPRMLQIWISSRADLSKTGIRNQEHPVLHEQAFDSFNLVFWPIYGSKNYGTENRRCILSNINSRIRWPC